MRLTPSPSARRVQWVVLAIHLSVIAVIAGVFCSSRLPAAEPGPTGWKGTARGSFPATPDRPGFPDRSSNAAAGSSAVAPLPPPSTREPFQSDPEPAWVPLARDSRLAKVAVPGVSLERDENRVAVNSTPTDGAEEGTKSGPTGEAPAPAGVKPTVSMERQAAAPAKPASSGPAPPVAIPATLPSLPPVDQPPYPPVPVRPLPASFFQAQAQDNGAVVVGGVTVPIPSGPSTAGSVRQTSALFNTKQPPLPASPNASATPLKVPADPAVRVAKQPVPSPAPAGPTTAEPPIRSLDSPRQLPPFNELPAIPPLPPSADPGIAPPPGGTVPPVPPQVPSVPVAPPPGPVPGAPPPAAGALTPGMIDVNGVPLPYDSLSQLVDGGLAGSGIGGCAGCNGCGDGHQCPAGAKRCEPFPAKTCVGRFIGLVYESICCPDPCYKPRWEPITAAAFFTDAPRPVTQTRFRWDYGSHFAFPDRGEFFWPRADGNGRGPKPNAPALGTPFLSYHELYLDQEIATAGGAGSITISLPYRSVNPFPFAPSAAGFSDMQITAKSLLFDSELFLFAFQMRTYVATGNATKGLGTGHTSLEPGLIAGVRVSPDTYAVAQVQEWIPIGGDPDYMGAALRYSFAFNHILWRPVKDVQLIGTWEMNGIAFQDGAFTDAVLGPLQKLSGQTTLNMGLGARLFFCDKFDLGAGWTHGLTGKYLIQDQLRVEFRYRY